MSHSETIELSDDDDIIELQNEFEQVKSFIAQPEI